MKYHFNVYVPVEAGDRRTVETRLRSLLTYPALEHHLDAAIVSYVETFDEHADTIQFKLEVLEGLIGGTDYTTISAISDRGTILGSVELTRISARSASFRNLFVAKQYRVNGIGRALVEKCCELAREKGVESIGAAVEDKPGLVLFYKHLGFIVAWQAEDGSLLMAKVF